MGGISYKKESKMIPYFKFESFQIGPLTIYVWGIFVVLGILAGLFLLYRKGFLRDDKNLNLILYLILAGIIGGRLGYVLFYDLGRFLVQPIDIIKIWEGGMSSFGGFLATAVVLFIVLPKGQKLRYLDILTIPFIITWMIARIGCFMIHDHPGRLSDFFLAVQFPTGARHDMALYEILAMVALLVILTLLGNGVSKWKCRFQVRDGFLVATTILFYTTTRFFLDFLRIDDSRYFNLTPAQYGSILFFIIGL
ncbi:MAG: prolipoprotein diacylglyceryl transferase family protein, partial [Patescibacteria group bacterium]|nr:prolipoprotein diacylglyceryl transferase family protein [Patescibacteria group bacterium]